MGYLRVDPTKVSVNLGGVPLRGFADGDMIVIDYDDDWVDVHSGTQGEYAFVLKPGRKGTITIRLAAYSAANAPLTVFSKAPATALPFFTGDKSSTADFFTTPAAMLSKMPTYTKSGDAVMNEWVYKFGSGEMAHTGAKEVDFS